MVQQIKQFVRKVYRPRKEDSNYNNTFWDKNRLREYKGKKIQENLQYRIRSTGIMNQAYKLEE